MQRVKIIFSGEMACFLQTGDKFRPREYVFYCEPWIATGIAGIRQRLTDIDVLPQFGLDQLSGLLKALSLCSFGFAEKAELNGPTRWVNIGENRPIRSGIKKYCTTVR